jgi:hypothetical protein
MTLEDLKDLTLAEIEVALRGARRRVFSDDPIVADAASAEIRRLKDRMRKHPDERARKDQVRANRDESLLRRWA